MLGKTETRVGFFVLCALTVFVYMGFQIGAFRFDRGNYNTYTLYFKNIAGLARKADVKIAGVKVGWVESVELIAGAELQAKAEVMILKEYALYNDAYGMVRQDGLLGPKFVEVIPGDPLQSKINSGESLGKPNVESASIDEIIQRFKEIADNVTDVTASLKDVIGGEEGKERLHTMLDNLNFAAERVSSFSQTLDRSVIRNEENIDAFFQIGNHVRRLSEQLESNVLPSFQGSVERISEVFDRDFGRVANSIEGAAEALEGASVQARDGLRSVSSVAEKIDEGRGLLGKLVNEDETYHDLKVAVQGLKNYLTKIDRMQIVFDSHFESMHRPAEFYKYEDSKGYFSMRIHPNADHFYQLQLVSTEKGYIYRRERDREYFDTCRDLVDPATLAIDDHDRLRFIFHRNETITKRNQILLSAQFGKVFRDIAVRFGLFENSAGVGFDLDIPFRTDKFRWVTTLEMFDMNGWNRIDDRRPHMKWLNRMFFMRNLYFTFGADDFISKRNASVFAGAGIRFGDDDVKYLLSSISGASTGFVR